MYIRTPKTPKWTYVNVGGNPVYNAGAVDLQDIELNESMFVPLIIKIMQYCGVNISNNDIVQISNGEEQKIEQKNNIV